MKKTMHFRAPVSGTFRRKSPIEGLLRHMGKIRECISVLKDGLNHYYEGDYENFSSIAKKVSELEHEADLIKGNIRAHLPSSILMPVDKKYFLWLLREQDAILDHAENLVEMLDMRHTKIPKKLRDLYIKHADKVFQTAEAMENAVGHIRGVLQTSFMGRERGEAKEIIHEVHQKEWEADQVNKEIVRGIYEMENSLKPMDVYHLIKIADWMDDIADHAENAVDWLRAMIAK